MGSNFKTHCLGAQEGLPGSARVVSRTQDRNCSSTTDNCRRRAAAATDALRAYCCTAEHRYYPPSHEKADTGHGVRARETEEATPPGRADVAGNRSPPSHEDSHRVTQRYTFHETYSRGVVRSRGSSVSSGLLKAQPGSNVSLDAAACVYGDHFCAKPKREPVSTQWCSEEDQVEQTFKRFISITTLFLSAVPKRKQMVCKFRTTHLLFPGVFIQENLSSNRDAISIRFTLLIKLNKICSAFVKSITTEFAYQEKSLSGSPFRKNWYIKS